MIRPPPRSTLFPYTPLSRSQEPGGERQHDERRPEPPGREGGARQGGERTRDRRRPLHRHHVSHAELDPRRVDARSEEHTSELQSRQYLVCRLLLEKKKTTSG